MPEKIVDLNNVKIFTETFGSKNNPTILLIHGAGNSMLSWETEFCERLAAHNRFVIRYDNRDTGLSDNFEVGNPPYSLRDLVADAFGIIKKYEIDKAHIVGLSQGAAIAQLLALDYSKAVKTITLISAKPGDPGHEASDLKPMSAEIKSFFSNYLLNQIGIINQK